MSAEFGSNQHQGASSSTLSPIEPAGWRLTPIGAEWFVGSES